MTELERLLAIEAIKRLKAKYFYYADTKDWKRWRDEVWAEDASMEAETPIGTMAHTGVDAIIEASRHSVGNMITVHMGHMPEIDVQSPTHATGRWVLEDILRTPDGKLSPNGFSFLHGFGHYHDTYECSSAGWRIKTLKITRLDVKVEPSQQAHRR